MAHKNLVIERPQKTLVIARGNRRAFEVMRGKGRELVINRSMLPGPKGEDGAGASEAYVRAIATEEVLKDRYDPVLIINAMLHPGL